MMGCWCLRSLVLLHLFSCPFHLTEGNQMCPETQEVVSMMAGVVLDALLQVRWSRLFGFAIMMFGLVVDRMVFGLVVDRWSWRWKLGRKLCVFSEDVNKSFMHIWKCTKNKLLTTSFMTNFDLNLACDLNFWNNSLQFLDKSASFIF
jgi:hypothetical protein